MKPIGLVPELKCSDINQSLNFYKALGFSVLYERPEEKFAYLKKGNAEMMLEQVGASRDWLTRKLEQPFGRGVNFQIETESVEGLYKLAIDSKFSVFLPLEEKWYRKGKIKVGNRQFIIQDSDGYLLRFYQDLGERSL